ncbi:MAG TPA: sulfatase-like hydrolase/transferase [Burkholderiales bacterium]|nr:sulfatase-like hydrolase/transferase [Burkholderiales bacterium]
MLDLRSEATGPGNHLRAGPLAAALLAALVTYLLMNYLLVDDVITQLPARVPYKSAAYIGWLGCGFVTLLALFATAPRMLLYVLVPVLFVSLVVNYAYASIANVPLSLDVIAWLPHEAAQLSNAWAEYRNDIASAILKALAALAALVAVRFALLRDPWLGRRLTRRGVRMAAVAAFLGFHAATLALQPPLAAAETNLVVFGMPSLFSTIPEPRPVSTQPARAPLVRHVVLVVDESVTHEAYKKLIAPRVRTLPAIEYGEAASTANCSAASNALLRWGVERARIREPGYDPRTNPMIWGYAKAAGFRTVLIDGQSTGNMHNYVNPREFALIDEFVAADRGPDTDHHIARMLNERLRRPGREFIYVVKRGAHFPYEMNYPAGTVPADASRAAKYAAAITHASAGFFAGLDRTAPLSDVLMIYTSDHGQDFRERAAHCNPRPRAAEYSVPLVVLTAAPPLRALLSDAAPMQNRASHLNIFPTLLYAFGYARPWLEGIYGPTLAGPPAPYVTYVSLGWRAGARGADRHTVRASDFVESASFPRRGAREARGKANDG